MPGARDALCHQALQLLAKVCPRSATAAKISFTTCGTVLDPDSETQVSAAARRDPRALGWGLGAALGKQHRLEEIEPKELSKSIVPWPDVRTGLTILQGSRAGES